jgi:hypothetical protein
MAAIPVVPINVLIGNQALGIRRERERFRAAATKSPKLA